MGRPDKMAKISFSRMDDFAKVYIAPLSNLPARYVEQITNNNEIHFSIFRRSEQACNIEIRANRTEFYKILLMTKGSGEFDYGIKTYRVKPISLIFVKPSEVKACRETTEEQDGYYCTFTEQFYSSDLRLLRELKLSTLFAPGAYPVIQLTDVQKETILGIFEKLHFEFNNYNDHSEEILRLYLRLLLIESTRIYSNQSGGSPKRKANFELTRRFHELLERQFSIMSNGKILKLKSPSQFAGKLSVHPNHLNASVKQIMGKSTRDIINNRILTESQILLKYTDKQISEISYLLGFKESSAFIHFFKKGTGVPPTQYKAAFFK
jgi:AraC family transcriptional regulator, transcriptional activator of pobA